MTNSTAVVTVSIVSHGHGQMLLDVLRNLLEIPQVARVIVTLNVPEPHLDFSYHANSAQRLTVVNNMIPQGFGANHNNAFELCETTFFCVLNPDVRLNSNPFPELLDTLETSSAALVAPIVVSSKGSREDSIRRFPTIPSLVKKAFGLDDGRYRELPECKACPVDWVGGMFMLFRTSDYRRQSGFDEGFFLYYEDVDICVRLWKGGRKVMACPGALVIHDAQRSSRHKLRFALWHIRSVMRYLRKHWLRLPETTKWS